MTKSCGSFFEGIDEKVLLNFETGTKCHAHPREMADGAIYEGKLDL